MNEQDVVSFFTSKGYEPHQAAGIAGNLMQESTLNPTAKNPTSGAFGLAQWLGSRKKSFMDFALKNKKDIKDPTAQLEFIDHELNTTETRARDKLLSSKDATEAAFNFSDHYERAGANEKKNATRANYANRILSSIVPSAQAGENMDKPISFDEWVAAGKPKAPVTSEIPSRKVAAAAPLSYEEWVAAGKPKTPEEYDISKLSVADNLTRKAKIALGGAAPGVVGAGAGALLGALGGPAAPLTVPAGALIGSMAVPAIDLGIMGYNYLANKNIPTASQSVKNMLGTPTPATTGERMLDIASSAISPAGIEPAAANLVKSAPGLLGRAGKEFSRAPVTQLAFAPTSAAVSQGVAETSDNPILGAAAGLATAVAGNTRMPKDVFIPAYNAVTGKNVPLKNKVPSAGELSARAQANYDVLDNSGFQLDAPSFNAHFATLPAKLRKEIGYVVKPGSDVDAAIKELTAGNIKDVAEITTLRKVIGSLKASGEPRDRQVAMQLMDEFDDYVLNAPPSAIVGGNKSAIDAWKAAREDYAKMKKSEIFTSILDKSELATGDKGKTIASRISTLAQNDKRMRLFTPAEQEEIRKVARGGPIQSLLNRIATFSPMTPAAAIFTAVNPWGAYTAAGGMSAKAISTVRQEQKVNNLAKLMRLGTGSRPPMFQGATGNLPLTYREATNAINMLNNQNQNQNALAQ
jgi:hypothetical protein